MSARLHLEHRTGEVAVGESLFDSAERLGLRVPSSCAKQGRCKECLLEILAGEERLNPRTRSELHLHGRYRLACCANVTAPDGDIRCQLMRRGALTIERRAFQLPSPDARAALEPTVTRDDKRVLLDGNEIARSSTTLHGLAIDVGTTTVVLRLVSLESGEVIADAAFENPQRFGGSDVMARIRYDSEDGLHTLNKTLIGYVNHAIRDFPVDPASIFEVVVSGNPTMRDLFFRLPVASIGQHPFRSITEHDVIAGARSTTALSEPAYRLKLGVNPKARVYGLPIISGHVGADAAACMLAIDLAHEERVVAIMDIGTNTELIIGNRDRIVAASCPAGPAFEGGLVTHGMPALTGAIERVRIGDTGRVWPTVIGGGAAEGLCGSGLVSLLGELQRTGRINALGRFSNGDREFVVNGRGEKPITLSEADTNALAQAKGANVAGLRLAAAEYGVRLRDIEVFYIAGGFGRHLDLAAAKRIGLVPDLDDSRFRQIGNASIEGATTVLLSRTKRAELESLVRHVIHCELEQHPHFFDVFVDGCHFGPLQEIAGQLPA